MSASKDYVSLPLRDLLEDIGARTPTPGGGSVAALVGALGAALARMTIHFTVGKPKYAEHAEHLNQLLGEMTRAGEMFMQLMQEDMAAYERFSAAKKAGDPEEQQRAIATAVAVPMEIVVLGGAVVARIDECKDCVNSYLFSDFQVGAILAGAAAESAATNVRINLKEMTDRREADRLSAQLDTLLERARRHRDSILHHEL